MFTNPREERNSQIVPITTARMRKTAATRGLRRSRNRESSRVSSSAGTFSTTSRGRGDPAGAMISNRSGTISRPPGAFSMAFTVPPTRTTDSRERLESASITGAGAFFRFTVTWTMPVRSRTRQKVRPPRSRTSWTQPAISARPLPGVMDAMGLAIPDTSYISPAGVKGLWIRTTGERRSSFGSPLVAVYLFISELVEDRLMPIFSITGRPAGARYTIKIYLNAIILEWNEAHRGFHRRRGPCRGPPEARPPAGRYLRRHRVRFGQGDSRCLPPRTGGLCHRPPAGGRRVREGTGARGRSSEYPLPGGRGPPGPRGSSRP